MECSQVLHTHWKLSSLVVFTGILSLIGDSAATPVSTYLRGTFQGGPGSVFNHFLVYSNGTGEEFVYVGARSWIYQLDINLLHLRNDSTDPDGCGIDCEDNDNTILAIAPSPRNHLILCRTYDGRCEYRDLTTLVSSGFHNQIVTKRTLGSSFVGLVGQIVEQQGNIDTFDSYLFVAPTSRNNDDLRPVGIRRLDDQVPALTLNLDFATEIIESPTTNDVKLIDGMEWNDYIFFFLNVLSGSSSVSKLGRVCTQNDDLEEGFPSYVEIKLSCGIDRIGALIQAAHIGPVSPQLAQSLGISTDDDALFTIFTRSNVDGSVQSWLCIYPMPAVQERFIDAVYGCGSKPKPFPAVGVEITYIKNSMCNGVANQLQRSAVTENMACRGKSGSVKLYTYAEASNALEVSGILELQGEQGSIITQTMENQTVAFISSLAGNLQKVHIEAVDNVRLYETVDLEVSNVLRDVHLDEEREELFILSEEELLKLDIINCAQYTTCDECIRPSSRTGDPFCGWCTLEAKCSRFSNCEDSSVPLRWLSYKDECPAMRNITPSALYYEDDQPINFVVDGLPTLQVGNEYTCRFNGMEVSTTYQGDDFTCASPSVTSRPEIPDDEDSVTMTLEIFTDQTSKVVVQDDFPFYDCSHIHSCIGCVNSTWGCQWCVYNGICTHDSDANCGNDFTIITPDNGPSECPQLDEIEEEILLPVGVNRGFTLRGQNLPTENNLLTNVICELDIQGEAVSVPASFFNSTTVICQERLYTYDTTENPSLEFPVGIAVKYGSGTGTMIDDAYGNKVTLYDCNVIGGSCTTCVSTSVRPVLNCGWCQPNCQITEEDCTGDLIRHGEANQCPAGEINNIIPTSGPIEGNTILTITGTNLGQNVSDILSITVANVDCIIDVVNDTYVPGLRVNCLTGRVSSVTAGSVRAEIRRGGLVDNATYDSFTYTDPSVNGFSPQIGIAAGGTIVEVTGTDLNTGRDARVTIGGVDCAIQDDRSSSSLSCETGRLNISSPEGEDGDLILIVDGAVRNAPEGDKYTYVGDPEIVDYSPKGAISAGGITQEVTGSGFIFVQEAEMVLDIDGKTETVVCTNKTDTSFQCPTPAFNSSTSGRRRRQTPEVSVSFALDGYSYTPPEENQFAYFPNPDYNEENYNLGSSEGGLITITGTNLNALPGADDFITVCIGPGECTLSDVQANFLTCITPDSFPGTGGCNGEALDNPQATYVVVRHGENLEFVIGTITYPGEDSILFIIVGVVAGFVFLCIIVFAIVFAIGYSNYLSRIKDTEVEMKRLMDDARTQVVEGFFIQQEMSDIQEQLKGLGMPFVSNQDYMKSMLFYGAPVKPLASDPENPSEMEERAMMEFSKLLSKKEFLKVLIQTVDNSKSSTIQKSNIASLLTVILVMERKFRYFTSVLMSLMTNTICEAADKNRLKNLFKRTETVEDKLLTNWIALAMFKFVKESVGHPLYLLYQALKIQCEKGPVDAVTGQSFLSLSFDNLLTESKEFTALKLNVESEIGTVEVIVLDVDTITQVKEKILDAMYRQKHTKFQRAAQEVDLVIKSGMSGALILRDRDTSSQPSLGWLQLNSLSHYGINDGATVTLVTKQEQPNAGPIAYNGAAENFFSYNTQESQPLANNHEPDVEQQDDVKTYHLVQSADQEEEAQSGACSDLKRVLCFQGNQERRKIREIYLQRLVSVKNSIQDFVEEAINAMFTIREDEYVNTINNVPFALRFLFKYFDEEASRYDNSAEVAGTWKNNSLPLRFWATILSHPSFIFNMRQSQTADACVIVLNQMLDNACKSVVPKLKANSSPSRLLFNKELPGYIELIKTYYHNIAQTPALQEDELKMECARIDAEFEGLFSRLGTLKQLYELVRPYESTLIKALEEDELCQAANFASSLQRVGNTLDKATD